MRNIPRPFCEAEAVAGYAAHPNRQSTIAHRRMDLAPVRFQDQVNPLAVQWRRPNLSYRTG
jgi:hypothetical protein